MTDEQHHALVQENVRATAWQIDSVLSLIHTQPKRDWPILVAALGLDGVRPNLNEGAKRAF